MKPTLRELQKECVGTDPRLIAEHLSRLDRDYFRAFTRPDIVRHLQGLSILSSRRPVELLLRRDGDPIDVTVLAFDYPAEFSLITGVLAGTGFSIASGEIFTYAPAPTSPGRRGRAAKSDAGLKRRRIVDHFRGTLDGLLPFDEWTAELRRHMEEIIRLLEAGSAEAAVRAKHRVNEMVAARLSRIEGDSLPLLYPVQIEVDNSRAGRTTLRVVSQDTPAFLYALSNALSLRGVLIEHVRIGTIHGRVEDQVDIVDSRGEKILDEETLRRIKLSVLLTKQFTYFLTRAPDPHAALCRFEQLVEDILKMPERGQWMNLLVSPHALRDLARVLGASDFIWEDLIRLQYEVLLPVLQPHVEGQRLATPPEALAPKLAAAIAAAGSLEEKKRILNEFKDREIFLIDLDHILRPGSDAAALAEPLTRLAEFVVRTAADEVYADLALRFGRPRTVGGLEAAAAIFGLGKFGGVALGYASDIELLFVYGDNGKTDGPRSIENSEFFEKLARETARFIAAKRKGIFHVDLELRPHGRSGPWACSLETFCRYYGPGGPAHSYERLALVRLRAIGGNRPLGEQVERLRDEFVYAARSIDLTKLRELRERQLAEKVKGDRCNAKFSPGALVDLEYDVQILQVLHGLDHPDLRTPRIHEALSALSRRGVLSDAESRQLVTAYYFLRRLINGLRMLRGSASDLHLPAKGSDEFAHLARRMGYERGGALEPEQQLYIEFETHTAIVRRFVERHFGRDSLPGRATGSVADLVLSESVPAALGRDILKGAGFREPKRAARNLRSLAGDGPRRDTFARLALLACDTLRRLPDPDMALNNWERFAASLEDPAAHYERLLSQPRRLEILMAIFAGSQFLADTLIRDPLFLEWATDPAHLQKPRDRATMEQDLVAFLATTGAHDEPWMNAVRRFRRRDLLRIGTRDICLQAPLPQITSELSALADVIVDAVLRRVMDKLRLEPLPPHVRDALGHFCILALGKLGGEELNYSSDIDLIGLCDDESHAATAQDHIGRYDVFGGVMERVGSRLSAHTETGHAYRVDLRLRPYGGAGHLATSVSALADYYLNKAEIWEIQALLKMRPVAGDPRIGRQFLEKVKPVFLRRRDRNEVAAAIGRMRHRAVQSGARPRAATDVKSGLGGIRDIEFLVQAHQLIGAPDHPDLIHPNTLDALGMLGRAGVLPGPEADELAANYVFLRRVEHCLQILEDRQIHEIPDDRRQIEALAKRVMGVEATAALFMDSLNARQERVRALYRTFFTGG
jgi:glutamate-ammonia-ligase adenylyltransferase